MGVCVAVSVEEAVAIDESLGAAELLTEGHPLALTDTLVLWEGQAVAVAVRGALGLGGLVGLWFADIVARLEGVG